MDEKEFKLLTDTLIEKLPVTFRLNGGLPNIKKVIDTFKHPDFIKDSIDKRLNNNRISVEQKQELQLLLQSMQGSPFSIDKSKAFSKELMRIKAKYESSINS